MGGKSLLRKSRFRNLFPEGCAEIFSWEPLARAGIQLGAAPCGFAGCQPSLSELLSPCLGETFNPGSLSAGINLSLLKPWFLIHQQSQTFALGQSLPQCEWENLVWKCIQNQAERIFYLLMIKYTSARGSELVRLVLLCMSDWFDGNSQRCWCQEGFNSRGRSFQPLRSSRGAVCPII